MWTGWGWSAHSHVYHDAARRRLLGAIRRLLDQETRNRVLIAQAGAQGLVGIRMQSGVYRGLSMWHTVTREFWDELDGPDAFMNMNRDWLLRHLRWKATDHARWKYGVEVNPATWFHKIYDERPVQ